MKRRNRFIIGLTAAVITFGSLQYFVGDEFRRNFYHHHHGHYDHGCGDNWGEEKPKETPENPG